MISGCSATKISAAYTNSPTRCPCGKNFYTPHAILCKKGGFATLCHNKLSEITGASLKKGFYDVAIAPILQPVTGNNLFEINSKQKLR